MTRPGLATFFMYACAAASGAFFVWETQLKPWREVRRPLSELTRASGPLQAATIRYGRGKATGAYLALTLTGQPQGFGLWASMSEQTLDTLRAQLQPGQLVVVYYDPDQADTNPSDTYFNIYQVEAAGRVLYAWEEKHRERLQGAIWSSLFGLVLVGLPALHYLRRHFTA